MLDLLINSISERNQNYSFYGYVFSVEILWFCVFDWGSWLNRFVFVWLIDWLIEKEEFPAGFVNRTKWCDTCGYVAENWELNTTQCQYNVNIPSLLLCDRCCCCGRRCVSGERVIRSRWSYSCWWQWIYPVRNIINISLITHSQYRIITFWKKVSIFHNETITILMQKGLISNLY